MSRVLYALLSIEHLLLCLSFFIRQFYNVTSNPRFESGYQSREIILKKFIDHFEENHHAHCNITKEDFDNYYAALSASVDDDTYFDLVIRQVYKLVNPLLFSYLIYFHEPFN